MLSLGALQALTVLSCRPSTLGALRCGLAAALGGVPLLLRGTSGAGKGSEETSRLGTGGSTWSSCPGSTTEQQPPHLRRPLHQGGLHLHDFVIPRSAARRAAAGQAGRAPLRRVLARLPGLALCPRAPCIAVSFLSGRPWLPSPPCFPLPPCRRCSFTHTSKHGLTQFDLCEITERDEVVVETSKTQVRACVQPPGRCCGVLLAGWAGQRLAVGGLFCAAGRSVAGWRL